MRRLLAAARRRRVKPRLAAGALAIAVIAVPGLGLTPQASRSRRR